MLDAFKTLTSGILETAKTFKGDWNENDSSSPNYIKNRTHWEESKVVNIFDKTLDFSNCYPVDWGQTKVGYIYGCKLFSLVVGEEYEVIFDGESYSCVVLEDKEYGNIIIGNGAFVADLNSDNGLPFAVGVYGSDTSDGYIIAEDQNSHAISIITEKTIVHKIDEKYLPEISGVGKEGAGEGAEIFNNYEANIAEGYYSHAEGDNTMAYGYASHAEGSGTQASEYTAHAEGGNTVASGECSHAEGYETEAIGYGSHAEGVFSKATTNDTLSGYATTTTDPGYCAHAEGYRTVASGAISHAEGNGTTAEGNYSHSEGTSTRSEGDSSHAEGKSTYAGGNCSHAEGYDTTASGDYSHAEGYKARVKGTTYDSDVTLTTSTAYGYCSHAEGYGTVALGAVSHAEGNGTKASGYYAHSEGHNTVASGDYGSHAEGYKTTASSDYGSHAEGHSTTASSTGAHAEGRETTASGGYSHAEGYKTTASGSCSHAEGEGTTAVGRYQHVHGRYNIIDTGTQDIMDPSTGKDSRGEYAHIVGNGKSSTTLSNAHTLDWDGNAWFAGDVYVKSTSGKNKDDGSKKLATTDDITALVGDTAVSTQISNATANYYTKAQIDAFEFITVADIDEICGNM